MKVFVNGCGHDGLGVPLEDSKWNQVELTGFVAEATRRGIQVWLHSLTAEGVRMAARAVRDATGGVNRLRHRIEHGGDFLDVADLPLVVESGALMVTTPQFLHSMSADSTGPTAPVRSILAAGVPLLGGTDSTGTVPSSVSILGNIATAVGRRRSDGTVFHGDEALTVDQALRLFTVSSAFGGFLDDDRGTLSVGSWATSWCCPTTCGPSTLAVWVRWRSSLRTSVENACGGHEVPRREAAHVPEHGSWDPRRSEVITPLPSGAL